VVQQHAKRPPVHLRPAGRTVHLGAGARSRCVTGRAVADGAAMQGRRV
ncbi:MAG: hypothetical protein AVDCRST_MAG47-292, partial [uncultured Nocardioidaceae bacterium]